MDATKIQQRHQKAKFNSSQMRFLHEEELDPTFWEHDTNIRRHYLDDGKLYKGDEREMLLAEIHNGANIGCNVFPHADYLLYIKGAFICKEKVLAKLKLKAEELLNGKDSKEG